MHGAKISDLFPSTDFTIFQPLHESKDPKDPNTGINVTRQYPMQ